MGVSKDEPLRGGGQIGTETENYKLWEEEGGGGSLGTTV